MNRKASLVLVAMMVSALGMAGCNRMIEEAAGDDGSAGTAAPETPAPEPATASPAPAVSNAPVAASPGGTAARAPVINPGNLGPVLGEAASIAGRTAARARAAYEQARRHERMREQRARMQRHGRGHG
jgi:hypothetical protein